MRNWIVFFICCLVLLVFWILIVTDDKPEPTIQTTSVEQTVATQASEPDYADYYVPTASELTDEEAAAMGLTGTEEVLVIEDNPEPYVITETSESSAEG